VAVEFKEWPKTTRLFRDIVVTEKIDGTNAAIGVAEIEPGDEHDTNVIDIVSVNGTLYKVWAQSRSRIITPGKATDNYGFAGWVAEHAYELAVHLEEGLHFGEWWGSGIQRGYGLTKGDKRFSLFNVDRFQSIDIPTNGLLDTVPFLYSGVMDTAEIAGALSDLAKTGSVAAEGYMNPEGVCIYHTASRLVQKATLDNNDLGKWEVQAGA
jgi:hypothetical protein